MHEVKLLQEIYAGDPWRMMVCCILLNQTRRQQVDRVVFGDDGGGIRRALFEQYPTADHVYDLDPEWLEPWTKPTGFGKVKAKRIVEFSREWCEHIVDEGREPEPHELHRMPGMGAYAVDSYAIFHMGRVPGRDWTMLSNDKEILAYLERGGQRVDERGTAEDG